MILVFKSLFKRQSMRHNLKIQEESNMAYFTVIIVVIRVIRVGQLQLISFNKQRQVFLLIVHTKIQNISTKKYFL